MCIRDRARILDEVVQRCSPFVSRCLTAGNRDALTSDGTARRILRVDADAVTENSVDAELCTKRAHQVVAFLDDALLGNDAYLRSKFHASLVAPLILPAVEKALVRDPRDVAPTQKQMAATRQAVEGLEIDLSGRGYGSPSLVKALDQAATTAALAAAKERSKIAALSKSLYEPEEGNGENYSALIEKLLTWRPTSDKGSPEYMKELLGHVQSQKKTLKALVKLREQFVVGAGRIERDSVSYTHLTLPTKA